MTDSVRNKLDALDAALAAATLVGILNDEENHARIEAEWFVLQSVPRLVAALRAVLDLADEMEGGLYRGISIVIRAAVTAALTES